MHRTLIAVLVLAASFAPAQSGEEWTTFPTQPKAEPKPAAPAPPTAPPKKATPPETTAAPVTAPATASPPAPAPAARPEAKARVEERLKSATSETPSGTATGDAALPIVSRKERFEAGTEPHSPATRDNLWNAKENSRVTLGQAGIGTAWISSAMLGPKGVGRVGFLGEYLSQSDFPVRGASDVRSAINFGASFQPFEWGEAYLHYGATANTNNRTSPNLLQALGDLSLGLKGSKQWVKGLWAGVDLRLLTFSGVGNQSIDRFALGFRPALIGTYDLRSALPSVPVVFTMNLGFTFDNTARLVTSTKLNAAEEFALGINRYHRFDLGLGLEVPLPWVTPFLEYGFALPLGAGALTGPDGAAVSVTEAMNQTFGLGAKVTALKDLTVLTGFNFGLARSVGLGVPATAPWNFFLGASFAIDPFQRGETRFVDTVRERKVEQKVAEAPKTSRVEGTVTDADTKKPVAGVIVTAPDALPSASDDKGRYGTHPLTGQTVKLTFSRDGYRPLEQQVALEPGKTAKLDLALTSEVKKATLELTVASAKKPVRATVTVKGPTEQTVTTDDKASTPAKVDLAAGTWTLLVNAEGFLSQTRDVQVPPGATMPVAFEMVPVPKKALVIFKGDKIEILQQVHFATGKSQILADSFNLLAQVVDVIIKNNVKRVKVEGHTDNRGAKAVNQALSEERARAVVDYLVAQGIDRARLESAGYGDSSPVAPNLTARGRELNRRVEFIVLEK